jgi:pimeloyl-ACP methyl ester carboxylesterase
LRASFRGNRNARPGDAEGHDVVRQALSRYMADARAMWSLGRDARRLSVGDAPGRAYLRVRPSIYYWSAKSTMPSTRDWIASNALTHQQFTDASHWPMIDQPTVTAQAIQVFFRSSFAGR